MKNLMLRATVLSFILSLAAFAQAPAANTQRTSNNEGFVTLPTPFSFVEAPVCTTAGKTLTFKGIVCIRLVTAESAKLVFQVEGEITNGTGSPEKDAAINFEFLTEKGKGKYTTLPRDLSDKSPNRLSLSLYTVDGLDTCADVKRIRISIIHKEDRVWDSNRKMTEEAERKIKEIERNRRKKLEEVGRICSRLYNSVSNKKLSELTVRESELMNSCKGLGLFQP
jgi:hypothetical protein